MAYAKGGIITYSWHAMNPVTGGNFYDTSGRPVSQIVPGGSVNDLYRSWLENIAHFANNLKVDDVLIPIIFRPFHENTGTWFWWGATHCTGEEYIDAWRYTVHYLRDTLDVHNFLYAYSPGIGMDYNSRYPGDDYVDITGFDLYEQGDYRNSLVNGCRIVVNFAEEHGKVSALTETGVSYGMANMSMSDWFTAAFLYPIKNDPVAHKISWCLFWTNGSPTSYWIPTPGDLCFPAFKMFFQDSFTVFENNLPDVYKPIIEDVQPPVFMNVPESNFISFETEVKIEIRTDERAELRYSQIDEPFGQMPNEFSLGQRGVKHQMMFSCEHGKFYTYYVRGKDTFGNVTPHSLILNFSIDTLKTSVFWTDVQYDDSSWKKGQAPLGYRNGHADVTEVDTVRTVYFRNTFNLGDTVTGLGVLVKGHDGAVAYINGREIGRIQIYPDADVSYKSWAMDSRPFTKIFVLDNETLSSLKIGENLIAVEIHAFQTDFPNMSFDARIFNNDGIYLDLGSEWKYSDKIGEPEIQIKDKTTDVSNFFVKTEHQTKQLSLQQNYPNPFNHSTFIRYDLPEKSRVTVFIYNSRGEIIKKLEDSFQNPGGYTLEWKAEGLVSGLYFYKIKTEKQTMVKKCLLIR
jgi:mannan endo-1,4-beta-mannosidase